MHQSPEYIVPAYIRSVHALGPSSGSTRRGLIVAIKRKLQERTERRDLLKEAGIEWWSSHDVRRTIQQTLDEAGIPGGASVILAHDMKNDVDLTLSTSQQQRENFMRNRVARITKMAYGAAQFGKLKADAMQIWTDRRLEEYESQKFSSSLFAT